MTTQGLVPTSDPFTPWAANLVSAGSSSVLPNLPRQISADCMRLSPGLIDLCRSSLIRDEIAKEVVRPGRAA